jgi:hypothetical protein
MSERPELDLNKNRLAATLTPPARRLHQWVLRAFTDHGSAPRRTDLERAARDHGIDPGPVLTELARCDVLAVDEHGEIRAAYPFSPVPTRHRVSWTGGPSVYAMCAIDALGMSAMLGVPITITSTEPSTDRTVTVHVDRDTAHWNPDTAVVLTGSTGHTCCPSVDRTCGTINFFTTPAAACAWAASNPALTTTVLDQDQALTHGIAEFGTLLRPVDPEPDR